MVFASSLVASVGVFFYQKHVETQLQQQVAELNTAIADFSQEDMDEVRMFNNRLTQARERLEKGVSIVSILDALEASVLQAVSFEELNLVRADAGDIELEASITTDSFDSALFQRGVFERSNAVNSMSVEDLALESQTSSEEGDVITDGGVRFIAKIGVLATSVPNVPKSVMTTDAFSDNDTSLSSSTATSSDETVLEETNEVTI
jgi:hypothetical protein